MDAAAQRWYEELLERYPEFQVEFRDVPDAENGFLQYLAFMDEMGGPSANLPMPDSLRSMLSGEESWDAARLEAWIAANEDLYSRLLGVAEAPAQSANGIDLKRYSFLSARFPREVALLLHGVARLQMESGSPEEALRHYAAAMNFARHFDGTEIHSLLGKTVAMLVRSESQENFRQNILPQIAEDPGALGKWREALTHVESMDVAVPKLLVGEWHLTVRALLLPAILTKEDPAELSNDRNAMLNMPDPDALLDAYSAALAKERREARSMTLSEAINEGVEFECPAHLSEQAREVMGILGVGSPNWLKGQARAISLHAMHDAAFAVLLGEPLPSEPNSGQPFLWDEVSRMISAPPEAEELGLRLEPIAVP